MLMRPNVPPDFCHAHTSHVHVPTIDVITLGLRMKNPGVDGVPIHDLHLREANPLLEPRRGGDARDHHQLHELLTLEG